LASFIDNLVDSGTEVDGKLYLLNELIFLTYAFEFSLRQEAYYHTITTNQMLFNSSNIIILCPE